MTLRGLTTAVVVVVASFVALAQTQDPPTFRSTIEAVQIDVYVTDAAGNPVRGLTIDDFEVIESGKPQPITTFEAVDIPIERAEPLERQLAEPDVLTNTSPPGRVYVFALDEVSGANILRTRRFIRQFIEEHFGPNDLGAIALTGRGLATSGQDFTGNRRLLLNAADRFSGGFGSTDGSNPTCRAASGDARDNIRVAGRSQQNVSLRSLTEMMARIPGRHKALLFFTECVEFDVLDLVDYNGGVLGLAGEDAHAAMAAATRSNIAIYPIDPTGLTPEYVPLNTKLAFRSLADATGGFALIDSNSFKQAFERIVRDNSTYYMLAFNSAYEKDDGKYVRMQVRVKRPGLTVRTREGYVAPTRQLRQEQESARLRAPATPVSTALANPLATSGIPMRVYAAPFKGPNRNAAVALALEVEAASLGLKDDDEDGTLTGPVNVRYILTDAKRNVYPEVAHNGSVQVKADPPGLAPLDKIRVRVVSELQMTPGRYQLRVAVGSQVAGSVVYDLEVPDFDQEPLAMSGLMLIAASEPMVLTLNSSSPQAVTRAVKCYTDLCRAPASTTTADMPLTPSVTEPVLRGGASGAPTTRRDFTAGEEIVVVAEVYDNAKRQPKASRTVIDFSADLRGADGKVIPLASEQQPTSAFRQGVTGHAFKMSISIPDVPPGQYALRVQAHSDTDPDRVVSREIPITVRR